MLRRTQPKHRSAEISAQISAATESSSPRRGIRLPAMLAAGAVVLAAVVPTQAVFAATDTSAPSAPGSAAASYYGGVGAVVTWGKVSASDLAGYHVYRSTSKSLTLANATLVATTTALKATDAAIPAGATDYYAVTAFDKTGNESKLSSVKSVTAKDTTKPSSPSSLKATVSASGVALDWSDNDEVDLSGYIVSRAASSSGTYAQLTASPITTSAFVDAQAPSGTKAYYRVSSVDRSGNVSSYSSTSATRPAGAAAVPATPAGLKATVGKTTAVALSWSSVSGATSYVVSRGTSASGPFTRINSATLTSTSYTDAAAKAGTTAFYTVVAVNAVGTSAAASVSAIVPADTTPPSNPGSPKVTILATGGTTVSWRANTEADLAGYTVLRRNSADTYVPFGTTLTTPSFTDPAATEGTTTYYRVYAVDVSGNRSSYLAVTVNNPNVAPGVPTGFTVKQDAVAGLDLAWTAPKDTDLAGYSISRSTTSSGTYVLLATVTAAAAGNPARFVDSSAPKGATVYYRITAQDQLGNVSKVSSTVSGTSLTTPVPIAVDTTVLTVGSGKQFATIASALGSIPTNSLRFYRIDIDPGTYDEAFEIEQSNVTLHGLGTDSTKVVITANRASGTADPSEPGTTYGTAGSAVVFVSGTNVTLNNLTVSNTFDETADPTITSGQAVALRVEGDRFVADTVRLLGNQDTVLADTPKPTTRIRQYYVNSYFEGDVDYLFGAGTAVFDRDTFNSLDRGKSTNGYLTAASTDKGSKYGFLITNSKILSNAADGTVNLGRPWHPSADPSALASVVIMNTYLPSAIDTAAPWDDMASTNSAGVKVNFSWQDARFDEFNNFGPGATVNANRPQLTAKDAANATPEKYLAGKDGWNPVVAAPSALPATPTGVVATADSRVVNLDWNNDLSAAVTSWSVYRATATGAFAKIATVDDPSYSDTTVSNGVEYRYVITADTKAGASSVASAPVDVLVAAAPLVTDITVDPAATANGTTVFTTLADALAAAPAGTASNPTVISLAAGRYAEYDTIAKPYTIIVGATGAASDVVITGNHAAGTPTGTTTDGIADTYGTSGSATLVITGNNVQLRDLTVENNYVEGTYANGQAVALRTTGDRLSYTNVRLLGNQDTYYANSPSAAIPARSYFFNSYIEGDVDFIFGRGTVVIDNSTLNALDHGTSPNGAFTAASTDTAQKFGVLITNSRLIGSAPDGSQNLGRPWQPGKTQADGTSAADTNAIAQVVVRDSWLGPVVSTTSTWTNMVNSGITTTWQSARFNEYNNSGPAAGTSSTRPQLSAAQAAEYTANTYLAGTDGWNPVVEPAADVAPATVTGLTATADDKQVGLTWNTGAESDVVAYRVYRSTGSNAVTVDADHLVAEVSKPTFIDKALANGTTYHYVVVAVDRGGNVSAPTAVATGIPNVKPLVADLTVAADGSGDYTTVQAALTAITAGTTAKPKVIIIKPGTYREVISSAKANVLIVGSTGNPRDVVITFDNANGTVKSATTCPTVVAATCGTAGSATATLTGSGVQVRDLTIANTFDSASHPEIGNNNTQAVALRATGDRQVYTDVRLLGVQDTLNADANGNISADGSGYPRQYYVNSFIEGNVDFIFGRATAVFDRVTIHATAHNGGTIFAPSTASKASGYLVVNSRIASDNDAGSFALGRPWRSWSDGTQPDTSRGSTVIRDSWISGGIATAKPWVDFAPNVWSDGRFAEYQNTGPGATTNANRPQLTDAAASGQTATAYLAGTDGWNPVLETSANVAPAAPVGVTSGVGSAQVLLTWQENQESDVTGYRVYRNGSLVATTAGPNYTDTGLTNGTAYSYTVTAIDAAGNESAASAVAVATPQVKVDATVDPNGTYPTLQSAVAAASGSAPWVIRVLPGTYTGTTTIARSNLTIIGGGTSAADVVLTNGTATPTLSITGSSVTVTGISVVNTTGTSNTPAVSMTGDKILLNQVALTSTDRTVWADVPTTGATSKQMIENSTITGANNIVLGRATLVMDKTTIIPTRTSGTVFIPSTTAVGGNGFLFINSTIAPAAGISDVRLGGPYAQGTTTAANAPQAIVRDSVLNAGIKSAPWQDFNGYKWTDARFGEYNNTGAGAAVNASRPQLSPADSVTATVTNWIGAASWYPAVTDPAAPADATPTASVTGLAATPADGSIALAWTAPADSDLVGYRLYRSTTTPVAFSQTTLLASLGTVADYSDAGLINGTTYYYAVRAQDAVGNLSSAATVSGVPAAPVVIVPPVDPGTGDSTAPAVPAGVKTILGKNAVTVAWTAGADTDLASYDVVRSTSPFLSGTVVGTVGATATSYTDTTVAIGTQYSYSVIAKDLSGNASAASSGVVVTPIKVDIVVAADGSGDATTLQAVIGSVTAAGALDPANPGSLANGADYTTQGYRTILIKPGTYTGPFVSGNRYGVNLVGATGNPADVVLTAPGGAIATLTISAPQWTERAITLQSVATAVGAQATALQIKSGDKEIVDNVRLLGDKQTLLVSTANVTTFSRVYVTGSYIEGAADLILGRAVTVVNNSTIHVLDRPGASLTDSSVASASAYGFLIANSNIVTDGAAGSIYLGRPYSTTGQAQVVVRNTTLGAAINATQPWKDWDAVTLWTAGRFYEYQNSGAGSAILNPATRPQLSDTDAANYTVKAYLAGADAWNPAGQ